MRWTPIDVGVVVIGRNEGARLIKCLESVCGQHEKASSRSVVYVDSGSSDGSPAVALERGVSVVELDMSTPFTAARARNAGWRRVESELPSAECIQFVDGDCELMEGWLERAAGFLEEHSQAAIVCGRLVERNREESVYNRLCDLEWNVPPGVVRSCGGIFMIRTEALREVGGFNEAMIAGEEPDLCLRLRLAGWEIHRLPDRMATHDAAMTRFGQWWKRSIRGGHAYAEGAWLHRASPERPWRREVRRNWVWGLIIPVMAVGAAWPTLGLSLLLLALYPLWMVRIVRGRVRVNGDTLGDAWLYAAFCMLAKYPQAWGQALYHWRRLTSRRSKLIEYKDDHEIREARAEQCRVAQADP